MPNFQNLRSDRRQALAEQLADRLLVRGLAAANLRALAAAAGTSDRMLLYYYPTKQALIAEALTVAAGRLRALLDAELPMSDRVASPELLRQLLPALRSDALAPYMALWLEMAAGAARGDDVLCGVAGAIGDGFLAWVGERLLEPARAPALLALVEGLALLDAIGRPALANAAVDVFR